MEYVQQSPHDPVLLVFPTELIGPFFPSSPSCRADYDTMKPGMIVELLDTQTGKTYQAPFWQHYSPYHWDGNKSTINEYMVRQHYCQCHRKTDASSQGAETDAVCEGSRFVVKRLFAAEHPELTLYSETLRIAR